MTTLFLQLISKGYLLDNEKTYRITDEKGGEYVFVLSQILMDKAVSDYNKPYNYDNPDNVFDREWNIQIHIYYIFEKEWIILFYGTILEELIYEKDDSVINAEIDTIINTYSWKWKSGYMYNESDYYNIYEKRNTLMKLSENINDKENNICYELIHRFIRPLFELEKIPILK